jgi:hypothetical protein
MAQFSLKTSGTNYPAMHYLMPVKWSPYHITMETSGLMWELTLHNPLAPEFSFKF